MLFVGGKDSIRENKRAPLKRGPIFHPDLIGRRFQLQPSLIKYLNKGEHRRSCYITIFIIIHALFFAGTADRILL